MARCEDGLGAGCQVVAHVASSCPSWAGGLVAVRQEGEQLVLQDNKDIFPPILQHHCQRKRHQLLCLHLDCLFKILGTLVT